MQVDKQALQDRLRKSDFTGVFTQELGWDFPLGNLTLTVAGKQICLQAVAEKRGLVAFVCAAPAGEGLPDYAARRKIEREVAKHRHQHLIVFTDAGKTTQVWQWVKRELGKPAACREHTYYVGQPGDALIQKLTALAVSLQEEESLTHVDLTGKVKKAFDVEKVTKRFYDRFQKEHEAFLKLLKGIPDEDMQRWYVSVMLNRLMFIYFIQSKGFLGDADRDYLRTKLVESKLRDPQAGAPDRYYREFLCPLFFEGFAKRPQERSAEMNALLGAVPYLNGGLFLRHQIEELHGAEIRIPDAAFEKLFEFFHGYRWHLDERPLKADNEINPDVLGYIFEKYINQKQMGAYYTKEDITEYIAKNTIIPFLFDATAKRCPADFAADAPIWRLLSEDPDRYIYAAVRRGVVDDTGEVLPESALPDFVRLGMHDPKARMFERRYNLGEADLRLPPPGTTRGVVAGEGRGEGGASLPSPSGKGAGGEGISLPSPSGRGAGGEGGEKLTLPTETWREYVRRRQRCLDLRERLRNGEVASINDLITLNLDIRQFAQDAIVNCQSPELLAALFDSIRSVTVLDPTCGSGAFLFAALNVLEPLYEACLDRMESFLAAEDGKSAAKARNLPSPAARAAGSEGKSLPSPAGRGAGGEGKSLPSPSGRGAGGEGVSVRPGAKHRILDDFRQTLDSVNDDHPNARYFILKSIIIRNLFGVDIMEEATEICKLRLFLKLVAQVDPDPRKPNLGVEPLPDIDFNIRAGNTLVGYTTIEEIRRSQQGKLAFTAAEIARLETQAKAVADLYAIFCRLQTHGSKGESTPEELAAAKDTLRGEQQRLADQLDRYLASDYGIDADNAKQAKEFAKWRKSHQPFHWFIEFYGIMRNGGFDVIIGNPPYVEYSKVRKAYQVKNFAAEPCGNLYSFCIERSYSLLGVGSRFGFIVQAPIVSTQRMAHVRRILRRGSDYLWYSTFDDRPSKLFDGMHHARLAIVLSRLAAEPTQPAIATTRYQKWYQEERPFVFATLSYLRLPEPYARDIIPKFRSGTELSAFDKIERSPYRLGSVISQGGSDNRIFYKITGVGHWFTFTLSPPKFWRDGVEGRLTRENSVAFGTQLLRDTAFCSLCSTLHYWLYQARTNCRDFNPSDLTYPPVPTDLAEGLSAFGPLAKRIMACLEDTSCTGSGTYEVGGSVTYQRFRPKFTKPLLDEIDTILAKHYGLAEEELDFIANYDIKYRMGQDEEGDGEE